MKYGKEGVHTVVGDLVTSLVDTEETEVAFCLEGAALDAVDGVGCQCLAVEGGGARVADGIRGVEAAEPIADPI